MTEATVTLVFVSGERAGERVALSHEMTIGREGDITIEDGESSRRHAMLRPTDGGVEVTDLDSLNGTSIDGRRLPTGAHLAGAASTIQIGTTTLSVEVVLPPADATRITDVPIANPDATRVTDVPIANPDATRVTDVPIANPDATRITDVVPPGSDHTVVRSSADFQPTVIGRPPALEESPPTAGPGAQPEPTAQPATAAEPETAVEPETAAEPEPAAAAAPPTPPKLIQKLFGYLFGGGPQKIPIRMAIVLGTYTLVVVAFTVLIYSLVS